jgi:hypothetical protein
VNPLTLQSIPVDWKSTVYHNLTELSLDNLKADLSQIVSALRSSPFLCTLSMNMVYISVPNAELGTVALERLQSVEIDGYGIEDLLSLLEPGTAPLAVTPTLALVSSVLTSSVEKTREFLGRSKVVPEKSTAWFALLCPTSRS